MWNKDRGRIRANQGQPVGWLPRRFVRSFKQDPEFSTPNTIPYAISLSADPPLPSRFSSTVKWIVSTYLSNNPPVPCPLIPLLLLINQRHAAIHEDGRIVIVAGRWHGMAWACTVPKVRRRGGEGNRQDAIYRNPPADARRNQRPDD